jgi:hypothetical protein
MDVRLPCQARRNNRPSIRCELRHVDYAAPEKIVKVVTVVDASPLAVSRMPMPIDVALRLVAQMVVVIRNTR